MWLASVIRPAPALPPWWWPSLAPALQRCGLEQHRYLQQLDEAATREGASKLCHYVQRVRGGYLEVECYGRAEYMSVVRERSRREALAQLRTGLHWARRRLGGGLDLGFLESSARAHTVLGGLRTCPISYCPLYSPLREQYADLFAQEHTLQSFLQPAGPVAHFADACRQQHAAATIALSGTI